MTSFNGLLLAPAAAVRLAERRRLHEPDSDYKPELTLAPEWLNSLLEQPLRLEARWLASGRTMPAGLRSWPCSKTQAGSPDRGAL